MKLYCKAGACSLSPHIVLRECGFDFTQVNVDLAQKVTECREDYWQINPKSQVPTLELVGNLTRYHTLECLSFISSELHKTFTPLFKPAPPDDYKPLLRARLTQQFRFVDDALRDKAVADGAALQRGGRLSLCDGALGERDWAGAGRADGGRPDVTQGPTGPCMITVARRQSAASTGRWRSAPPPAAAQTRPWCAYSASPHRPRR
ncbi:Glutathione S-transferase GstA|nr:Glutathione S-transferase GstA [Candidatus Pantoea persica]